MRKAMKNYLTKAISAKVLEFNKTFQELGSNPEEEKKHEQERKMFEEARKGVKIETAAVAKELEKPSVEASAWNANAYHWEEKAVSEWASSRLKELIKGCQFEVEGNKATVTEIKTFTGDVIHYLIDSHLSI